MVADDLIAAELQRGAQPRRGSSIAATLGRLRTAEQRAAPSRRRYQRGLKFSQSLLRLILLQKQFSELLAGRNDRSRGQR